ncbi:pyridoxal-phosphate dependent enzyme [Pleomorphovibrio marinus]|uniref:pyridoxal-phosphate dependent enzyme n=1 Tax=Pleomorphovibrio marinus TaxID=2164132 RepID=UPI000E0A97C3|nr:pyridoxal-phosphate dependent enzyme [Pleomorphovibrio marinus]
MPIVNAEVFSQGIFKSIGNTPLIKLGQLFPDRNQEIFAKLEFLNPGGSHKDKTALHLMEQAFRAGLINEESTIIETTTGNLGIGLAQVCLKLKLQLILVVDPLCCKQTIAIAKAYGATIIEVDDPDSFGNCQEAKLSKILELLQQNPEYVWMNQFDNQHNPDSHRKCIGEILDGLENNLDYIYIPTSSIGTLMGCQKEVASRGTATKIIPVNTEGSSILLDSPGKVVLPGMGTSRPAEFLDTSLFDKPIQISDLESIIGCRQLLENEAIMAGGSTGSVVYALRKSIHQLPKDAKVAFIVADRGERYLDTIYNNQWVVENFTESHPYLFTNPYLV